MGELKKNGQYQFIRVYQYSYDDFVKKSKFKKFNLARYCICSNCIISDKSRAYCFFLWQGYVVRISGGNDKQGFPMKQGVMTNGRVRLLLSKGHSCYRPRRTGERKRKSVRGCIVDAQLSVLNLVIIKKGEQDIPGKL